MKALEETLRSGSIILSVAEENFYKSLPITSSPLGRASTTGIEEVYTHRNGEPVTSPTYRLAISLPVPYPGGYDRSFHATHTTMTLSDEGILCVEGNNANSRDSQLSIDVQGLTVQGAHSKILGELERSDFDMLREMIADAKQKPGVAPLDDHNGPS